MPREGRSSLAAARFLFALAIALYLLITALISARRFWHDELYTLYIAGSPTLRRLWDDLALDLNPPLEFLAVRMSTRLFGTGNYAVRLPSILGFLTAGLCLAQFVRIRLRAPVYSVLAMLVFWGSSFFYYATEARPYALAAGFLGLALVSWQVAANPARPGRTVWCLAFSVAGMLLSHVMALFWLIPLGAAQIAREAERRRVDIAVWTALAVPCAILFLFLRLVARFGSTAFPPAFEPSLYRLAESYYGSLKFEALALLAALGVAFLLTSRTAGIANRVSRPDLALIFGFLLTPAMITLALAGVRGAYFDRYALPVAFGYALAVTFFLASRTEGQPRPALAASLVLLAFFVAYNLGPGRKSSAWVKNSDVAQTAAYTKWETIRPDLPLVAASGLTFVEMDHYEDARTVRRLYYLTDRQRALEYAHATIFEGLPGAKRAFPIRANVAPYASFVTAHPVFLVLGTPEYPEDWLLRYLIRSRASVRDLGFFPGPYKDRELYLVDTHGN